MSEELSGLELRVAVGVAAGHIWKDDDDGQWKTTDRRGNHSIVDPRTWLDHYERDIAATCPILEKWHNGKWHRQIKIRIATTSVKLREQTAICEIHDGETDEYGEGRCVVTESIQSALAVAICRALVAAAETD